MNKLFFTICLLFVFQTQAQNSLENAKSKVETPSSKTNTTKNSTKSYNSSYNKNHNTSKSQEYNDGESNAFDYFLMEMFYHLTIGLVKVSFVDTPSERETLHFTSNLSNYPYEKDSIGGFDYYDTAKKSRLLISGRYLKNKDLYGNYFKTEYQFAKRISLTADYAQLRQNNTFDAPTRYNHFTMMANYYRARTQRFSLWYGIGARYVGEGIDKFGFAYNFGMRAYIIKPVSIETSFLGSDVNGSSIHHFNTQAKWHINQIYLTAGYDKIKISSSDFHFFGIGLGIYL